MTTDAYKEQDEKVRRVCKYFGETQNIPADIFYGFYNLLLIRNLISKEL